MHVEDVYIADRDWHNKLGPGVTFCEQLYAHDTCISILCAIINGVIIMQHIWSMFNHKQSGHEK